MANLVLRKGYPLVEHWVRTDDGYLLNVCNMPRRQPRGVVLLMHGLLDSSAAWVSNGAEESLGFILYDEGYDVWMGNMRGNTWSNIHEHLTVEDAAFWRFTWDEMATKDLPATVDYILNVTQQDTLAYIGHSQGTTTLFAGLAASPSLNRRISSAILLAPVAFVTHSTSSFLNTLAKLQTAVLIARFGVLSFLPDRWGSSEAFSELCRRLPAVCATLLTDLCGPSTALNTSRLPGYLHYLPAGSSVLNLVHWSQSVANADGVHMYAMDYGTNCKTGPVPGACNQRAYGSEAPRRYNLQQISVPLALLSGDVDVLATPLDVELLLEALSPAQLAFQKQYKGFGHLDFTWAPRVKTDEVYADILNLLARDFDGAAAQ